MCCIVPRGQRRAHKCVARRADLRDESFVSFPPGFDARSAIERVVVQAIAVPSASTAAGAAAAAPASRR
ncbi:hypothetical protein WT24_27660 [Burkholderia sp. MSMB1078WGS]|nr:hypothetical protein WT24_27660 [Burkholderia sp. MSMB1078WGS]